LAILRCGCGSVGLFRGPAVETIIRTGRWLAVHPGSGSEKNNWPEPNGEDFVWRYLNSVHDVFICCGGSERAWAAGKAGGGAAADADFQGDAKARRCRNWRWLGCVLAFVRATIRGLSHLAAAGRGAFVDSCGAIRRNRSGVRAAVK